MQSRMYRKLSVEAGLQMPSLASFESEMRRIVDGDVRFDAGMLAAYSTDASNYRQVPVGVVCPRHHADVIHAVALARGAESPLWRAERHESCRTSLQYRSGLRLPL